MSTKSIKTPEDKKGLADILFQAVAARENFFSFPCNNI